MAASSSSRASSTSATRSTCPRPSASGAGATCRWPTWCASSACTVRSWWRHASAAPPPMATATTSWPARSTPLAVKAAADPAQFPDQLKDGLRPWQVKKLYVGMRFGPNQPDPPTITAADRRARCRARPHVRADRRRGAVAAQDAGDGRGAAARPAVDGAAARRERRAAVEKEQSVFDGIDTSITGLAPAGRPAGRRLRAAAGRRWTRRRARRWSRWTCGSPTRILPDAGTRADGRQRPRARPSAG